MLSLEHYAITNTQGDPVPAELAAVASGNTDILNLTASSDSLIGFASLDCLHDDAINAPAGVDTCMADADALIDRSAMGFKDHAGKAWDGTGEDIAVWVGAFNRLAGRSGDLDNSASPNADCVLESTARFPLDPPEWKRMHS